MCTINRQPQARGLKLSGRWQAFAGCARRLSPVRGCRPHVSSFACNPNGGELTKEQGLDFFSSSYVIVIHCPEVGSELVRAP